MKFFLGLSILIIIFSMGILYYSSIKEISNESVRKYIEEKDFNNNNEDEQ